MIFPSKTRSGPQSSRGVRSVCGVPLHLIIFITALCCALLLASLSLYGTHSIEKIDGEDLAPEDHLDGRSDYVAYKRLLSNTTDARCIDGSQAAYYIRAGRGGGKNNWHVFFEGGGWCYDVEACSMRARTALGSSRQYDRIMDSESMRYYLSAGKSENPLMYDWNTVYVKYCDGSSFAGDAVVNFKGEKLYFRGKANRDETILTLLQSEGMSRADEVVLSGCSAGALGLLLGIDQMAQLIRMRTHSAIKVRGLMDSGFFMDYTSSFPTPLTHNRIGKDEASIGGIMDYAGAMRNVFTFANMGSGTHQDCVLNAQSQLELVSAERNGTIPRHGLLGETRRKLIRFRKLQDRHHLGQGEFPIWSGGSSPSGGRRGENGGSGVLVSGSVSKSIAEFKAIAKETALATLSRSMTSSVQPLDGGAVEPSGSKHTARALSTTAVAAPAVIGKKGGSQRKRSTRAMPTRGGDALQRLNFPTKGKTTTAAPLRAGKLLNHDPAARCVFAANVAPFVQTPIFAVQPRFDYWQVLHIYSPVHSNKGVNTFGARVVRSLQEALFFDGHPGHGAFVDSCAHHCTACSDPTENTWSGSNVISTAEKVNPADAFAIWYKSSKQHASGIRNGAGAVTTTGTGTGIGTGVSGGNIRRSLLRNSSSSGGGGGSSCSSSSSSSRRKEQFFFIQQKQFPCGDCCKCSPIMHAQGPASPSKQ